MASLKCLTEGGSRDDIVLVSPNHSLQAHSAASFFLFLRDIEDLSHSFPVTCSCYQLESHLDQFEPSGCMQLNGWSDLYLQAWGRHGPREAEPSSLSFPLLYCLMILSLLCTHTHTHTHTHTGNIRKCWTCLAVQRWVVVLGGCIVHLSLWQTSKCYLHPGKFVGLLEDLGSVLISVTIAATRRHDQKQLGEKGFTWFTYLESYSPLTVAKAGTQTSKEYGGRSWCRGHGKKAAYWLVPHGFLSLLLFSFPIIIIITTTTITTILLLLLLITFVVVVI